MREIDEKLHLAARDGDLEALLLAIEDGANPDAQNREHSGFTALHFAAKGQYSPCVKALIEAGANVCLETEHGDTALRWAQVYNDYESVRLLTAAEEAYALKHPFSFAGNGVVVQKKAEIKDCGTLKKIFDFEAGTLTQMVGNSLGPAQPFADFRNCSQEILDAYQWVTEQGQNVKHPFRQSHRHIKKRSV